MESYRFIKKLGTSQNLFWHLVLIMISTTIFPFLQQIITKYVMSVTISTGLIGNTFGCSFFSRYPYSSICISFGLLHHCSTHSIICRFTNSCMVLQLSIFSRVWIEDFCVIFIGTLLFTVIILCQFNQILITTTRSISKEMNIDD